MTMSWKDSAEYYKEQDRAILRAGGPLEQSPSETTRRLGSLPLQDTRSLDPTEQTPSVEPPVGRILGPEDDEAFMARLRASLNRPDEG
jgi:hypothetical protein